MFCVGVPCLREWLCVFWLPCGCSVCVLCVFCVCLGAGEKVCDGCGAAVCACWAECGLVGRGQCRVGWAAWHCSRRYSGAEGREGGCWCVFCVGVPCLREWLCVFWLPCVCSVCVLCVFCVCLGAGEKVCDGCGAAVCVCWAECGLVGRGAVQGGLGC